MTKWVRTPNATLCGNCAKTIDEGAPVLTIQITGLKRIMVRGECCAGEAAPDLPPLAILVRSTRAMSHVKQAKPEWMPYRESE